MQPPKRPKFDARPERGSSRPASASRTDASRTAARSPVKLPRLGLHGPVPAGPGEPHEPHRLVRRAAGRTRDAGDGDRDVGAAPRQRARRHLARRRLAHRAEPGERLGAHAEQLDLRLVRIGDESALEPAGAAGDVGDRARDQPAGARLGRREPPSPPGQRASRPRLQVRTSFAPARRAPVVIGVHGREAELAVDRERGRVVRAYLQIRGLRAVLPRPRQERRAGERRIDRCRAPLPQ